MPDTESFDQLYRTSHDRLALQLAALTGNASEANDVVQEAFMRAWTKWETLKDYDDPESWGRRVAHNLAVSRWRKARKLVLHASVPQSQTEIPGERLPIVAALQALPVSERRSIILHHIAGLSVIDVARELRAPQGTVKSWLARGRTHLAAELERLELDILLPPKQLNSSRPPNSTKQSNTPQPLTPVNEQGALR